MKGEVAIFDSLYPLVHRECKYCNPFTRDDIQQPNHGLPSLILKECMRASPVWVGVTYYVIYMYRLLRVSVSKSPDQN